MVNAPYYQDGQVTLWEGDCLKVLAELPDNSIDAVVTDPPYDLTSGKRGGSGAASVNLESPYGRARIGTGNGGGFMGKAWDATGIAFDPAVWTSCLRVLKPGGHLLAFGGTRTWHRLTCAVEDAGFEIRDSIAWLYGSGFPKSLDVSKAIDKAAGAEREVVGAHASPAGNKPGGASLQMSVVGMPETADITAPATDAARQWQGWGTALKPAFEPIVVARKPLQGTVANNVLAHGTGALNIDACRVATDWETDPTRRGWQGRNRASTDGAVQFVDHNKELSQPNPAGRWPANVVLDDSQAAELDKQSGTLTSGANPTRRGSDKFRNAYGDFAGQEECVAHRGADSGGASRFFPTFRYAAKAPGAERPTADGIAHPTVKPVELMRWLIRLVTPPDGLVLDPFAGSGTTGEAAIHEHKRAILIEREPTYLPLIVARLSKPMAVGFDYGDAS